MILSGPVKALDALNQDDIFVILDLTNLISGTHTLKPRVVLPGEFTLEGVIPETVEVVIRQQTESVEPDALALPALPLGSDITPTIDAAAGPATSLVTTTAESNATVPLTNTLEISPAQNGGQAP